MKFSPFVTLNLQRTAVKTVNSWWQQHTLPAFKALTEEEDCRQGAWRT